MKEGATWQKERAKRARNDARGIIVSFLRDSTNFLCDARNKSHYLKVRLSKCLTWNEGQRGIERTRNDDEILVKEGPRLSMPFHPRCPFPLSLPD